MDVWTLSRIFRWIHIVAAGAWLGEVVVVVFVLVPVATRAAAEQRREFMAAVFPRVFRLASVLSLTALTAGAGLYLTTNNWHLALGRLVSGRWGWSILIGASLGLTLTLFHFIAERRLEPAVTGIGEGGITEETAVKYLQIIPRVGLGILLVIFAAMMYAARGL